MECNGNCGSCAWHDNFNGTTDWICSNEDNGIEDTGDLNFKAWYELADYKKLLAIQESGKVETYQIWFGEEGVDGKWEWSGVMAVYPNSGASNNAREMSFSITDEGEEALHFVTE